MFSEKLRALKSFLLVAILTIVLAVVLLLLSPIDLFFRFIVYRGSKLGPVGILIKRIWFWWVLSIHGIKLEISGPGLEHIRSPDGFISRGLVIASNHQSLLDIPALFSVISPHSVFLAKKELKWIPFFGWGAWIAGTQFIDRARGSRHPSLQALDRLIHLGLSVVIFPEGTRSDDGSLLPFKRGAFVLAIKNKAPIIPVAISGSHNCLPKKSFSVRPGTIKIHFGQIVSTVDRDLGDRGELAEQVREAIRIQLEKSA